MGVLDTAATSKTWSNLPFRCEIADISDYFAANLVVPDEICLSDGTWFLLALSKLSSHSHKKPLQHLQRHQVHSVYVNSNS